MPTALLIIDYQNIHLTARDCFTPRGTLARDCLVHPLLFAEKVLQRRQERLMFASVAAGKPAPEPLTLAGVEVFRGAASNRENPALYAANQAQRAEWTRDRRVQVEYRTLRYFTERGVRIAQEKGVDVRVALAFTRAVATSAADVVILATHDTDLEPALDAALESGGATPETAGWEGCRVLRARGIRLPHTALTGADFVLSRDRRIYSNQTPPGQQ